MLPNVPGFVEHWRHRRIRLSLAEVDALMIYWTASVGWKQHSDRAENLLRGLGQQQNKATEKYDDWDSSWRTELKVQVIELKAFKTFFITLEKCRCHLLTISTWSNERTPSLLSENIWKNACKVKDYCITVKYTCRGNKANVLMREKL